MKTRADSIGKIAQSIDRSYPTLTGSVWLGPLVSKLHFPAVGAPAAAPCAAWLAARRRASPPNTLADRVARGLLLL